MKYETAQAIVFMAKRITDLGYMLENTFGLAYTDPISGSPNMLAIQHKLDLALSEATQKDRPLSICLADGDDLRRYNAMGYEAGDEVIQPPFRRALFVFRNTAPTQTPCFNARSNA